MMRRLWQHWRILRLAGWQRMQELLLAAYDWCGRRAGRLRALLGGAAPR